MKHRIICSLISLGTLFAQQQPAKPAAPAQKAATPAAKPAAKPAASGVDTVISMVNAKISEGMIIKSLRSAGKTYSLGPADMLKLNQAGVSENIITVMMDPKATIAEAAPPPAPVPPPVVEKTPEPVPVAAAATTSAPSPAQKRRMAVTPFDYSAVRNWVTYWFSTDVNIGQGIRAMLTTRVAKLGTITLLEREKVDNLMKEQDFGATNRVNQGTKAKIGKIKGADAILYGDIVIFGRDDKKEKKGGGINVGSLCKYCGLAGGMGKFSKEEKAVVAITYRIVDAETSELIDSGEARGESSRKSKDWSVFAGKYGGNGEANGGMDSANFQATIIGEATSDAVDKLVAQLVASIPKLPVKKNDIDCRVASIQGNTLYLSTGQNEGVVVGDRFEILQITGEVKDPATHEVLDVQTVNVGEFVTKQVREKVSIGTYTGSPLSQSQLTGKGYAARKIN